MSTRDEVLWERSKKAARQQCEEAKPQFWGVTAAIYKSMGGALSDEMRKSLGKLEALVKSNPAKFGPWDESSMLEVPVETQVSKSIAAQFNGHAEAAGDLEKAQGVHKYSARVAKPGGGFRYIYSNQGSGGGSRPGAAAPARKPAAPSGPKTPEAPKSQTDMAKIVDGLAKKDASAQRAALQNMSDDALTLASRHAPAGLQQVINDERKERRQRAAENAVKKSQADEAFEDFCKSYSEDIKKSLAESHPGWDAETLERRLPSQLRMMFRLHA